MKNKNINLENKVKEMEEKLKNLEKKIEIIGRGMEINKNTFWGQRIIKIFESNILKINEEKIILDWIPNKVVSAALIYDTFHDGDSIENFKNKCHGKFPTLVIIKTDKGIIFGGYASSAWEEYGPIYDNNSFCFSLNPNKKYNLKNPKSALYGYSSKLGIMLQFGCCYFRIKPKCTQNYNN